MDIKKVDKNFNIESENSDGLKYYDIPCSPFDLYGVFYEKETERFVRMPSDVAGEISENVGILNFNTAGGRIRFSTDSKKFCISVKYKNLLSAPHISVLGGSGFILLEERENKTSFVFSFMPNYYGNDKETKTDNGFSVTKTLNDGKKRNYILYFPNYNDVSKLRIGLDRTATVDHGKKYKEVNPVLYYGSSITQGGCASRADNCYQALISKWSNMDFINLGFSGSALGEIKMAEYLSNIKCSVFVCDYDFNAPTPDYLEKTHLAFYKKFREKQKDTPIILLSNPDTDGNFNSAKKRLKVIKKTFSFAKENGDRNVYLIDGKTLFGNSDRENCTVDGTHPNDVGFYRMAKKIYGLLSKIIY